MIPYQFENGLTIDLERLVAINEIEYVNASINKHSDWTAGEYYFEMLFLFTSEGVRRYLSDDKVRLEKERQQLISDWLTIKLG
jgi:hypothetical protein